MSQLLVESLFGSGHTLDVVNESAGSAPGERRPVYLRGLFLQGNVVNANRRLYPASEIQRAVGELAERIRNYGGVVGECDHPSSTEVNLSRASHVIDEIRMDGDNGVGRLRLLDDTPLGQVCRALVEAGVRLGVSSRGRGDLTFDRARNCYVVNNFSIVTVDIVASPSAPNAYPDVVRESAFRPAEVFEGRHGRLVEDAAGHAALGDRRARHHLRRMLEAYVDRLLETNRKRGSGG